MEEQDRKDQCFFTERKKIILHRNSFHQNQIENSQVIVRYLSHRLKKQKQKQHTIAVINYSIYISASLSELHGRTKVNIETSKPLVLTPSTLYGIKNHRLQQNKL